MKGKLANANSLNIMIPNHKEFIQAILEKKKVCLRLYSTADTGVINLICAPMDYGPGGAIQDGVNRYRFWDYTSNNGTHFLALRPEQIRDWSFLGTAFAPAELGTPATAGSTPGDGGPPPGGETDTRPA